MQRRQITLEDGRYLIFYTFDEETAAVEAASSHPEEAAAAGAQEEAAKPRAEAEAVTPQATEERRV